MRNYRLCLVGFGNVSRCLVSLLAQREQFLAEKHNVTFSVTAVVDLMGAAFADAEGCLNMQELSLLVQRGGSIEELSGFRAAVLATEAIAAAKADIMIELTPTRPDHGQPARDHILHAFGAGMHVITANKGPLVVAYRSMMQAAEKAGKMLKFGCATAAALPATNVGYYDLAGCRIEAISGILNGTSNFILSCMHQDGVSFDAALALAQSMGIAETDPSLDVDGIDTAIKLVILANALMGADATLDDVSIQGIRHLTPEMISEAASDSMAYKLIGNAVAEVDATGSSALRLSVSPGLVHQSEPLYGVGGTAKAVAYSTDLMGTLLVSGGNSNPVAAAAAILRDLINLAREEV